MTTKISNFLLELGTEELPPKSLPSLASSLCQNFAEQLEQHRLTYAKIEQFASPRRLALLVHNLQTNQADKIIERKGPGVDMSGQAVAGFAKSCGVDEANLEVKTFGKSDYYYFSQTQKGKKTADLLADICDAAIKKIQVAKPMRWADFDFQFARPVQWLVMMLDDKLVPAEIMGLKSGVETKGLRFAKNPILTIDNAKNYQKILLGQAKIEADFNKRRDLIKEQITEVASANKANAVIDDQLLNEVCALVECPQAFLGEFEASFLSVPQEALISAMQSHQKYFPLLDKNAKLLPAFICITNTQTADLTSIKNGNERVIRPRLKDAEFFWEQDKTQTLSARVPQLDKVLFMQKLGSMLDKSKRISTLSVKIAKIIGANPEDAKQAAMLSKADLSSAMVGEFADLQGIMGGYYALNDGLPKSVATAISEHYQPKFAGDNLPSTSLGLAVSIADKLDTIVGIYAIGKQPSGSKDPFALKRGGLGLMRIIIESKLEIELENLVAASLKLHNFAADQSSEIQDFLFQRLKSYYQDQKIHANIVAAVKGGQKTTSPYDFHLRVKAVDDFAKIPDAKSLIATNKRIKNILKDAEKSAGRASDFASDFDKKLSAAIIKTRKTNEDLDYQHKMQNLLNLKTVIDDFFANVMILDEDLSIRKQRLSLIWQLRELFLSVADITYLSK